LCFLISQWIEVFFTLALIGALILGILFVVDLSLLFQTKKGIKGTRHLRDQLSNSDPNPVEIELETHYSFPVLLKIVDELPKQFQIRDFLMETSLKPDEITKLKYEVTPKERGVYRFGALNVFASTVLRIVSKRYRFDAAREAAVYPSYIQMRKFEFLAINNRLTEFGLKKIRRIGHTMEFEQIKNYVTGDDIRTINWKATAKKGALMVNQYQDEKSQPIYSLIDVGRVMKMPFQGLKLLDYAINSTLAFSNIALLKNDKTGMLTFSKKVENLVPASSKKSNLSVINEVLYKIDTDYLDSDFGYLYGMIKRKINQRSLLILYTNFEHISALKRQLPYLKGISKSHLLLVVFFENTELDQVIQENVEDLQSIYEKTIAMKFAYEKRLIVKDLEKNGIYSILTKPQNLSVNVINKYLEFKSKGLI
jgi:uncharacterized protein (DUF58 family)